MLENGSLLHDICKIYTPKDFLFAPHQLTEKEFEIIKEHPIKGAKIISGFNNLKILEDFIRLHHYRRGYGYQVDGRNAMDNLPFDPRLVDILPLADSYAAISEMRRYNGNSHIGHIDIIKDDDLKTTA